MAFSSVTVNVDCDHPSVDSRCQAFARDPQRRQSGWRAVPTSRKRGISLAAAAGSYFCFRPPGDRNGHIFRKFFLFFFSFYFNFFVIPSFFLHSESRGVHFLPLLDGGICLHAGADVVDFHWTLRGIVESGKCFFFF